MLSEAIQMAFQHMSKQYDLSKAQSALKGFQMTMRGYDEKGVKLKPKISKKKAKKDKEDSSEGSEDKSTD